MCGRYTLIRGGRDVAEGFGLLAEDVAGLAPRYNIAPSQAVPVVRFEADRDGRILASHRWGLVPSWAKDVKVGYRMINARSETAASKPAFRKPFRERRCLVVADGFYEWARAGTARRPWYFRLRSGEPFAFAGLWERWISMETGEVVDSCTILTTSANDVVRPVHERMPVILPPRWYDLWLDPEVKDAAKVEPLMASYPPKEMAAHPVGLLVNSPRNDGPACVEPVEVFDQIERTNAPRPSRPARRPAR